MHRRAIARDDPTAAARATVGKGVAMVGSCFRLYRRCSIDCLPNPTGCWAVHGLSALNWYAPDTQGPVFTRRRQSRHPESNSDRKLIEAAMVCSLNLVVAQAVCGGGASAGNNSKQQPGRELLAELFDIRTTNP